MTGVQTCALPISLHETVTYLINAELPMNSMDNLTVPDFDEKIAFNGLS